MGDFGWFDIIIGILILLLAIRGVVNGFIREFLGLAGIVGGVYVASVYASSVGGWISANVYAFKNPSAISLVGFLVLLVGIWCAALLLAEILQKLVSLSALGVVNRILGFCFGALKVFFVFAILIVALNQIELTKSFIAKKTENSHLYPLLLSAGEAIIKLDVVKSATQEVKEQSQVLQ